MIDTLINPAKLLNSKWTAAVPRDREKHFLVTALIRDGDKITGCRIEAINSRRDFEIDWHELRDSSRWLQGWR